MTFPATDLVSYQQEGPVARVTLRRAAKHNALTTAMVEQLLDYVARAGIDDDVKAVVICGEGPAFCSGFDISTPSTGFHGGEDASLRARLSALEAKADWMRRLLLSPKPLVASIHGACIGVGTYIALVADFAIAADNAAFGLPEERFGSAGATWAYPYLVREIGLKRANEVVMTGRRFTAAEFGDLGLINRVVPHAQLAVTTESLCSALATLPREGIALNRVVKSLALATIGHLDAFAFHAGLHPHAEQLAREPDEFDFIATVSRRGLRDAIAERERRFGGEWWGW
jgi:enoyl-CoA hydratase